MITLQELITRARFLFDGAEARYTVFQLVNGKRTAKNIAKNVGRSHSSVAQDIAKLKDYEIIRPVKNADGKIVKKGGIIYEKNPLLRHVPKSYFEDVVIVSRVKIKSKNKISSARKERHIPNVNEILDILKTGETEEFEFKEPGIKMEKLSKEIAAFLHMKHGGLIFYGIDDDGIVIGSDIKRQDFDQRIHNSVRNCISPTPNINLRERNILGTQILVIMIPPWDKKTLYQFKDDRYYIRKGTNTFSLRPKEIQSLSRGKYIS